VLIVDYLNPAIRVTRPYDAHHSFLSIRDQAAASRSKCDSDFFSASARHLGSM
jgi:hypothetical protein